MPFSTPLPSPSFSQWLVIPIAKKGQGSSVKIVQASFKRLHNGKAEFNQLGQLFIDISETTANVHYISSVIKKQRGANYVLATSDGLPIEDSSGTQGGLTSYMTYSDMFTTTVVIAISDCGLPTSRLVHTP